ncbi:MAG: Crp/Fnr family transcriptional regulator [Gammaproteobacteria bacterium]
MKTIHTDSSQTLSRLPLFSNVEAPSLATLAAATTTKVLNRGDVLFNRGDPALGFYVVITGQIKLAFSSASGDEKIVTLIAPGQSFGEAVMFMEKSYPVLAAALVDSTVLHIPRDPVFKLLEADPSFARRMLAGLSMRLHSMLQDVESYSMRSGTERLVGYLLQNVPDDARNDTEIDLPVSKHVIASRLNLTPESYSRAQHRLIEEGLISVNGRHIQLHDLQRLRQFLANV